MLFGILATAGVGFLGFMAVKLQNIEVTLAVAVKLQEKHESWLEDVESRIRYFELNR